MTTNEANSNRADEPAAETTEEQIAATTVQPAVPDAVAQPAPEPQVVDLKRPSWLTKSVAVAGSVAAATFVIGGAAGYAIGDSGDDAGAGFNGPPSFSSNDGGQQSFNGPGQSQNGQGGPGSGGRPGQGMQDQQGSTS